MPRFVSRRSNGSPLREAVRWSTISNLAGKAGLYSSRTMFTPQRSPQSRTKSSVCGISLPVLIRKA